VVNGGYPDGPEMADASDGSFELGLCVVAAFATLVCRWIVKTWFLDQSRVSEIKA
jgi:hypothetical protein